MAKTFAISVVDDDELVREALAGLIRSLGFDAAAFDSGASFLNSDRCGRTDVLIADVQMPGMTGIELYSQLVASGNPVPTILVTAYPNQTTQTRAAQAGVTCFLPKPVDEEQLVTCIQLALRQRHADGEA